MTDRRPSGRIFAALLCAWPALCAAAGSLDAGEQARPEAAPAREAAPWPAGEDATGLAREAERCRAFAAAGWEEVPPGPLLRPGDRGPRVRALRARLAASGDLAEPAGAAFDRRLGAAVRRFQARHGLRADGLAGPRTLAALPTSAGRWPPRPRAG
jgi:peptidoglycan hydrolase-like protein with peptidoglycan-binding domain